MISASEIVTYTALFGRYDTLRRPKAPGRYVCFNDHDPQANGWEIRKVEKQLSDPYEVRRYKLQPYLFLEEPYTIWVDANYECRIDPETAADRYLSPIPGIERTGDFALHKHPERQCIYDEITMCDASRRAPHDRLEAQRAAYTAEGFPRRGGLYECGIMLRRHTDVVRALGAMWWDEVLKHTARDQISLPICLSRLGLIPTIIPGKAQQNLDWVWSHHG